MLILSGMFMWAHTHNKMTRKGRPQKTRNIKESPKILQFSPRGRPGRPDEVSLTMDQIEAIRLADYGGMDQLDSAKAMNVSRATFGRILRSARKQIAEALVTGKIIRISKGSVCLPHENLTKNPASNIS